MAKKAKNELDLIIDTFDKNTQEIINDFSTYYAGSSTTQYTNAICNMLFDVTQKSDVTNLIFEDYEKVLKHYSTDKNEVNSQDRYRTSFF